jgi:hypothetical protein
MSARDEFEHITTDANVAIRKATGRIFEGLLREIRELSRKKPEATMSASPHFSQRTGASGPLIGESHFVTRPYRESAECPDAHGVYPGPV